MATDDTTHEPSAGVLSRRRVLTGAGAAATGAVALASLGTATAEASVPSDSIATGPRGGTVVEFRGRIEQTGPTGETFTSFGIVYSAHGADDDDLFSASPHGVDTALVTVYATGALVARVLDQAVHALDIDGSMTVYQRSAPGADWTDSSTFAVGAVVARFDVTIQDVLTVFTPGKGLPAITGDMKQTLARHLGGALAGHTFGAKGQRLRMSATGLGTLVDPVTLNSLHEIAGSWTAE